ncbi:hypothetical protein CNYM01_09159 [Colletotrichum nymphaeae SA-01]|uniref:Uncharacterized protein n=1 Tax=Colletotrichum nymphaeae SA-01 TaxID=1460502 RepID=A0A135RSK3_9PEZI|nr:hypothetical protein CNYM01_09159 [Colletotrichum nymphaeae SA-01]
MHEKRVPQCQTTRISTYQVPINKASQTETSLFTARSPVPHKKTQRLPARRRRTPQLLSVITTVASDSPSPSTIKYSSRFLPGPGVAR